MTPSRKQRPRALGKALVAVGALVAAVLLLGALWWSATRRSAHPGDDRAHGDPGNLHSTSGHVGKARASTLWQRLRRLRRLRHKQAAAPRGGKVVFRAGWGDGVGQLGRSDPAEGSPEGPASFAVDGAGRVYVLDQVNGRIQVFAGDKVLRTITLSGDSFEDIAVLTDGSIAVLDRLTRRSVSLIDAQGRLVNEVALLGRGVPEGGAVTGLFSRTDGLWVEVAHRQLVRVMDAAGRPDPVRPSQPGRLSSDGSNLLQAALDGRYAAEVLRRPAGGSSPGSLQRVRVDFPMRIAHLTALESDARGRMYLGALMMRHGATPPFALLEQQSVLVVISPTGQVERHISLPAPTTPLEHLRSVRVSAGGTAWHLAFDARGATLRRYDG